MIGKVLIFLCVVSATLAEDLDTIMESITGTTKPSGTPISTTTEAYVACTNFNGEKGECVPYYKCEVKELETINIHYPTEFECASYLDVCCTPSERIDLTTEPAKASENSEPPK